MTLTATTDAHVIKCSCGTVIAKCHCTKCEKKERVLTRACEKCRGQK